VLDIGLRNTACGLLALGSSSEWFISSSRIHVNNKNSGFLSFGFVHVKIHWKVFFYLLKIWQYDGYLHCIFWYFFGHKFEKNIQTHAIWLSFIRCAMVSKR
jgi:hypothetical protein